MAVSSQVVLTLARALSSGLSVMSVSLGVLLPGLGWAEGVLNVGLVPAEDPRLIVAR